MFIFAGFCLIFGAEVKMQEFRKLHCLRNFATCTIPGCEILVFGALCTILSFMIYIYIKKKKFVSHKKKKKILQGLRNFATWEISHVANFCNLLHPHFVLTITFSFEFHFKRFWYRWKA